MEAYVSDETFFLPNLISVTQLFNQLPVLILNFMDKQSLMDGELGLKTTDAHQKILTHRYIKDIEY